MSEAIVFDIQHASFVDGPGIRTTVFLKGCNLRCSWCHNPESWESGPQILYYENRCTKCNRCVTICPQHALDQSYYPDAAKCTKCGKCELACPSNARQICGKRMSIESVFNEIRKDQPFYETSGGGVTFSGGECLLQIDFLLNILLLCHKHGIHTALDTAGNVPYSSFLSLLPYTDIFLYDIKCLDPELHKKLTGVSNTLIIKNYLKLHSQAPEKLIVRIPIIPGFNTTEQELLKIADFLHTYKPAKIELLPYHKMGLSKATALKIDKNVIEVPSADEMKRYMILFNK